MKERKCGTLKQHYWDRRCSRRSRRSLHHLCRRAHNLPLFWRATPISRKPLRTIKGYHRQLRPLCRQRRQTQPTVTFDFNSRRTRGPHMAMPRESLQTIGIGVGLPLNSTDGGTAHNPQGYTWTGVNGAWNGAVENIGGGGLQGTVPATTQATTAAMSAVLPILGTIRRRMVFRVAGIGALSREPINSISASSTTSITKPFTSNTYGPCRWLSSITAFQSRKCAIITVVAPPVAARDWPSRQITAMTLTAHLRRRPCELAGEFLAVMGLAGDLLIGIMWSAPDTPPLPTRNTTMSLLMPPRRATSWVTTQSQTVSSTIHGNAPTTPSLIPPFLPRLQGRAPALIAST